MIDIKFYQNIHNIKKLLQEGEITREDAFTNFATARRKEPVIFNIEPTNNCNMHCKMCPRTTQMTRNVETMSLETFKKIIDQVKPWTSMEWKKWLLFVRKNYNIQPDDKENHFFLNIIPQVINLHGYGEPLLDETIFEKVQYMTAHNLKSYFSSNPFNVTVEKGKKLTDAGLTYFKLSGDSIKLFEKTEEIIKKLISTESDTTFILDIVDNPKDYQKLQKMFAGYDTYMYQKSKDNQWYDDAKIEQASIHWLEPCQFPWSSMSIMSNGSVVPCTQDYDNEMVLGDVEQKTLYEIWNDITYHKFRKNMLRKSTPCKCIDRCDMKLLGDY